MKVDNIVAMKKIVIWSQVSQIKEICGNLSSQWLNCCSLSSKSDLLLKKDVFSAAVLYIELSLYKFHLYNLIESNTTVQKKMLFVWSLLLTLPLETRFIELYWNAFDRTGVQVIA